MEKKLEGLTASLSGPEFKGYLLLEGRNSKAEEPLPLKASEFFQPVQLEAQAGVGSSKASNSSDCVTTEEKVQSESKTAPNILQPRQKACNVKVNTLEPKRKQGGNDEINVLQPKRKQAKPDNSESQHSMKNEKGKITSLLSKRSATTAPLEKKKRSRPSSIKREDGKVQPPTKLRKAAPPARDEVLENDLDKILNTL